jgi:sortase A
VFAYVVYALGITRLEHGREQRTRVADFAKLLELQQASIGGVIPEGTPVAMLDVPRIGLHQAVVEGTTASLLRGGPGHLRSSPLPGQAGNVVIAGRRNFYAGPFQKLDKLKPGDKITAITGQGRAVYVVTSTGRVSRHKPDPISPSNDNRITLVTSAPPFVGTERLVAIARLETPTFSIPNDATGRPAARVNELRSDELALQGEGAGILALIVWTQLLLAALCIGVVIALRWARWPAYLVIVPIVALLVLLVFDSFTPLLPSTL